MMKRLLLLLLVLGLGLGSATMARGGSVDNLTLTLSNSGWTSGLPGTTQGWGFTLTNTLNYVVITESEFDITQNGGDGTYADFIGPNFVVVGPTNGFGDGPTVSQNFDSLNMMGVGSFAISPSATIGDFVLGNIVLTFERVLGESQRSEFRSDGGYAGQEPAALGRCRRGRDARAGQLAAVADGNRSGLGASASPGSSGCLNRTNGWGALRAPQLAAATRDSS